MLRKYTKNTRGGYMKYQPFDFKGKKMAVSQGFEPRVGYKPTLVFKTSALNRSANSPQLLSL
jgi:hypothetical protein